MMKLKNMAADTSMAANELLKNWDYDEGSLKFWRASTNFVYIFEAGGEVYFLRFVNSEDNSFDQITAEIDFLNYLGENKYPCSLPVLSRNGRYIESANADGGIHYGVVFPKVEGEMLDIEKMQLKQYEEWGRSLARLHELSSMYVPGEYVRDSWKEKFDYIYSTLCDFPEEKEAMEEYERVIDWLGSLPASKDNYGLVHYDFESDNVFLNAETNKYSIIDFDDSMYHWYVMDIVCALGDLDELDEEKEKLCKDIFMKGYRSVRHVDDVFIDLMPKFRRFDDLYVFARLLRSMKNSDFPDVPDWMKNIKLKLIKKCSILRKGFTK